VKEEKEGEELRSKVKEDEVRKKRQRTSKIPESHGTESPRSSVFESRVIDVVEDSLTRPCKACLHYIIR
jgi:hypothetical protein